MSDQQRTKLTEPATRALLMRQHVQAVAESILTDHRADEIFERAISSRRHVHGYSVRNRILQQWQAPMSRLVASLSAFEAIASEQGAETVTIKGKPRRVLIAVGARGVWIWGRSTRRRQFHDNVSDEEQTEVSVSYVPVATWAVEDIEYAATHNPFQLPDHVQAVDDARLYRGLMEFAADRGIVVEHRGLIGPRGVSSGGKIALQHGDSEAVQLGILAHELMHEVLLHHAPESRHLSRSIVEGEAEAGMAVLLRHFGHDAVLSPQYLRNHGVQPKDVLNSMDRILRATGQVIEFIEGREAVE
jgi:hypothetical protein